MSKSNIYQIYFFKRAKSTESTSRIDLWTRKLLKFMKRKETKGQIKSELIYEIINFPKNDPKNLKDFCPMYCKNSHGRNPLNFSGHFWFK